jgi:hypothetical protein
LLPKKTSPLLPKRSQCDLKCFGRNGRNCQTITPNWATFIKQIHL